MLILLNKKASGGNAVKKWGNLNSQNLLERSLNILDCDLPEFKIVPLVLAALSKGETDFVAAGGDGTINYLLNLLINNLSDSELQHIKLGAIGIGSSNDFHKPFSSGPLNGTPAKLNFKSSNFRDVGCIEANVNGNVVAKYFLINASVGITADANHFFNFPDLFLRYTKKINTELSILYAAIKTILKHKNFEVIISSNETGTFKSMLTNMGIIKNPNFSGNLNYGGVPQYCNGKFGIHLCYDMNKYETVRLLYALNTGEFDTVLKKRSWATNSIRIKSDKIFNVEFDGEVIQTDDVTISVKQKFIQVCQ
jgi:diacylglycerol kinase (ATP)